MGMRIDVRLVSLGDTAELTALVTRNLSFLAPWDPARPADHATDPGQRRMITELLARHADGTAIPLVITVDDTIVGRVTVSDIIRGAFQSAHLGYWVSHDRNGQGIATAAVAATTMLAFGDYGLHRLQAGTLLHNQRSQRVLLHNGFTRIGMAPRYLKIAGEWQDHLLFQRLAE
jgi:[ribosomal protein S5]-alanine N-acetyltransferase